MLTASNTLLRRRLFDAEHDFILAAESADLGTFDTKWSMLCDDFEEAMQKSSLDNTDLAIARAIATRVAVLAESLADLEAESEKMSSNFASFTDLALATPLKEGRKLSAAKRRTGGSSSALPPYLAPAYSWLDSNLHDPYPPASLKRSFAKDAGLTVRSVDDWFKNIRRHIGWVALCKTHFEGKRSLAVAAAGRVLRGEGDVTVPSYVAEKFEEMKMRLGMLYLSERAIGEGSQQNAVPIVKRKSTHTHRCSPLATPTDISYRSEFHRASPSSMAPSLVYTSSDSEDEDHLPDPDVVDASRAGGFNRSVHAGGSISWNMKRRRGTPWSLESEDYMEPLPLYLPEEPSYESSRCPSLASSGDSLNGYSQYGPASPGRSDIERATPHHLKRKRCLSDTITSTSCKRSRTAVSHPRAVSHPLPLTVLQVDPPLQHDSFFDGFNPQQLPDIHQTPASFQQYDVVWHDFGILPSASSNNIVEAFLDQCEVQQCLPERFASNDDQNIAPSLATSGSRVSSSDEMVAEPLQLSDIDDILYHFRYTETDLPPSDAVIFDLDPSPSSTTLARSEITISSPMAESKPQEARDSEDAISPSILSQHDTSLYAQWEQCIYPTLPEEVEICTAVVAPFNSGVDATTRPHVVTDLIAPPDGSMYGLS
ncbi:hypothetical protein NM688_g20 [Phlebia brevispora]|uniref:Uncharacterized protein n=1 Tax=Phlebia brevispora TaxID=194682 RepID=A0ACC1TFR3_9APHY|nr:hypothetical protein NM688_g20 [Phlebia brevispora]